MTQDPWTPIGANDQSEAALAAVRNARRIITRDTNVSPGLRTALDIFAADLAAIEKAYAKDAAAYRLTRSFAVVHLPAIMGILEVLRADGEDQGKIDGLAARLTPCLQTATQARKAIADGKMAQVDISMAVLEHQVVSSGLVPAAGPVPSQTEGGLFAGVSRFAKMGLSAVTGSTAAVQSAASTVSTEIVSRSAAGASLLATYAVGACEDGIYAIVSPITQRLRAAKVAVLDASVSALFDAGIVAIFFPPAVPFAVGLALLDAPLRYEDHLEKIQRSASLEKQKRLVERQDAADFAIAGLRGLAEVVRVETPWITLVIDVTSGDAEGTILAGRYIGKTLSALDNTTIEALRHHAPDTQTREALESWQRRVAA